MLSRKKSSHRIFNAELPLFCQTVNINVESGNCELEDKGDMTADETDPREEDNNIDVIEAEEEETAKKGNKVCYVWNRYCISHASSNVDCHVSYLLLYLSFTFSFDFFICLLYLIFCWA